MSALALLEGALSLGAGLLFALRALPGARALAACLGAALGLGLWSSLYAVALFAPLPAWAEAAGAALLLVLSLLASRAPRGPTAQHGSGDPPVQPLAAPAAPDAAAPRWLRPLLWVALLLTAAFALEHTLRFRDGGWDAWMIWNSRARALHRAPLAHFRDAFAPALGQAEFRTHGDYPLLLPGLIVQGYRAVGGESRGVPAALALALGALLLVTTALAVRALRGPTAAALCTLALASTPALAVLAAGQCADVPLSLFLTGALACALLADRQRAGDGRAWALCGALLSLCAWTKNEGLLPLFALPFAVVALRAGGLRARLRPLVPLALGALPVLLLLAFFKARIAPPSDLAPHAVGELLPRLADPSRWLLVGLALLRRLFYFQLWGVHLVAAVLAVALLARARRPLPPLAALPLFCCALVGLGFFATYLITPHDLGWHVRTSIDRLILQLWPSLLMGLVLAAPLSRAEWSAADLPAAR